MGSRFDPMLAKIVAHGRDRAEAFERLTAALDETLVLGVVTNLRFLRWLVRQPVVLAGEARTDTLDRIWPPDDWAERTAIPEEAWQAAAVVLRPETEGDPWAGGWRLNGPSTVRLETGGHDPDDRHRATERHPRVGRRRWTRRMSTSAVEASHSDWPRHPMSIARPARRRASRPGAVRRTWRRRCRVRS